MEHKINFIESPTLNVVDELLKNMENEGSFYFYFFYVDKNSHWNYCERLIRIGGVIVYDNTLWGEIILVLEEDVVDGRRKDR